MQSLLDRMLGVITDQHQFGGLGIIGDVERPKVQLPGGAASAFLMPITPKVVIWVTRHSNRVFVEDVDFVTGQGYNNRPEENKANEIVVISDLAVMNFKNPERMMQIQHYHPGHTIEEIKENTGFDLAVAPDASETPAPTQDVLDLIAKIDQDGVRLSEFH
jgi:glutaconate CoA-transferase subunit B